jgi:prophage regulatory protein
VNTSEQVYRRAEVRRKTGLPNSTMHRLIQRSQFPKPIKLGIRASGWLASEVDAWLAARIAARDQPASKSK